MRKMEYNKLEEKWRRLIHKFSNNRTIPGYDKEDIEQELRVVLFKSDQLFDPNKKSKFITYLYSAFSSKVKKLHRDTQGRKKNIPSKMVGYLPEGIDFRNNDKEDHDDIDFLTGLSFQASRIGELVLDGKEKRREWIESGMTREQIRTGITELKQAIKGGQR